MFYFIRVDQAQTVGCACSKRKCAQGYVSVNFSSFQSMTLQWFLGCITGSTKHFNLYGVTLMPFVLVSYFDFDHKPVERLPFTITIKGGQKKWGRMKILLMQILRYFTEINDIFRQHQCIVKMKIVNWYKMHFSRTLKKNNKLFWGKKLSVCLKVPYWTH